MGSLTGKEIKSILKGHVGGALGLKHTRKQGQLTCWAGCYRMLDNYHQQSPQKFKKYLEIQNPTCVISHCELSPCVDCDRRRPKSHITADLKKLGYQKTNYSPSYFKSSQISYCINSKEPVMAYLDLGNNEGHVLLISGIFIKFQNEGVHLVINDPDEHSFKIVDIADLYNYGKGRWTDTWVAKS